MKTGGDNALTSEAFLLVGDLADAMRLDQCTVRASPTARCAYLTSCSLAWISAGELAASASAASSRALLPAS